MDNFEKVGKLILLAAFLFGCFGHGCEHRATVEYTPPRKLSPYQELVLIEMRKQSVALERIADILEEKQDEIVLDETIMEQAPERAREIIQTKLAMRESKLMLEYWSLWLEVNDD